MKRSSGILMSMTSLPSNYGIGTMGRPAYKFIDFLKSAGQSYWQLLPLGPTSYGDSPYASFSSFAGNPYLIDLDMLVKDKLLKRSEINACDWGSDPERVDYSKIYESRFKVLRIAFERGREELAADIEKFHRANYRWVETYALYMSVKAYFGMKSWTEWPDESIRLHRPEAVKKYREYLKEDVAYYIFIQYLFYKQWNALRSYAHEKGIEFIGDIPIYVAMDSADVWSEPEFFQLDDQNVPTEVSGCPPDDFTADGQLWGNPLYDWAKMKADGYGWWIRRIEGAQNLYDVIRIDHFRGLESYWAVPYGDKTAVNGRWVKGPGSHFTNVIKSWFYGIRIIAEDLGFITPGVKALLESSGFPGMKVLEFAFDAKGGSDYLPHNCVDNSVCYIGTHDNETINGWVRRTGKKDLNFAAEYLNITKEEGWIWGLVRAGMSTRSELFVMQMQDVLELGPDARMNTPGQAAGNWQWRMLPDAATKELAKKLKRYCSIYGRLPEQKKAEKAETAEKETAAGAEK